MTGLFVKICGITRLQDAELASGLGAGAVGFVFWPDSPRYIAPEAARTIAERMPPHVMKVGVFVDEPFDRIVEIMDEVGLDAAQLHGHETPEYCQQLMVRLKADPTRQAADTVGQTAANSVGSGFSRTVDVVSGFSRTVDVVSGFSRTVDVVSGFSRTVDVVSGFSRTVIKAIAMTDNGAVDLSAFEPEVVLLVDAQDAVRHGGTGRTVNWDAAREIAVTRPTILAGGLNAANIKLAVRAVRPYGVDVSSGVESAPGVKDPARLRSFFEALHD